MWDEGSSPNFVFLKLVLAVHIIYGKGCWYPPHVYQVPTVITADGFIFYPRVALLDVYITCITTVTVQLLRTVMSFSAAAAAD